MKPFGADGLFVPIEKGGMRRLAVRGAGVTVSARGVALAIQVVATVVLARLLTPADFGVVAMVTTFSLLPVNVGLNGFTEAVVQWEKIHHLLASNLFWINIGAGVVFTVGFAAAGSLLARFYRDPQVASVAAAISLTVLFTSTSVMHLALLKRAMRFSLISANEIVAGAVYVIVAIFLACQGWGYWALVVGLIAERLSRNVGAWTLCRWVPGRPRRAVGTMPILRFAANVYGRFSVRYCARNMDNLLVGWRFNAVSLGFYKKAYDLFALSASQISGPLTVVAVAALSRLHQDPVRFKRCLMESLAVLAFVSMGVGAVLTLTGQDVVRLVLGPGWGESGKIFIFFGPGIGLMLLHGAHGWIHLSIGRADRWLRWTVLEFLVTALLFILALPWGPVGIAAAWTLAFWLLTLPAFWYAGRPIQVGIAPVIRAVWKYVAAALMAGLATAAVVWGVSSFAAAMSAAQALQRIIAISVLFGVLYLGAIIILHRSWAPIIQFTELLREMMPWSKPSTPDAAITATRV
ncbi:MAG: lipopolysaccharide biosynthesis protein [Terriglobia bacterium]